MSMGMPDTGDNNPFASARIVRTNLLMLLFFMVFYVLGQLLSAIPPIGGNLRNLFERFFVTASSNTVRIPQQPTKPAGGAVGQLQAQARQHFLDGGGPTTTAHAHAAVTSLIQIQKTIDALPESERAEAQALRDRLASELLQARMKAYFSASPPTRRTELDRQIRQDELMRRAWKASRSTAAAGSAGDGFPGGGGGGLGESDAGGSEDDRNRHLKDMLDRTSPEQRARYGEYRRAMEARRQQMGLTP